MVDRMTTAQGICMLIFPNKENRGNLTKKYLNYDLDGEFTSNAGGILKF